jgi:shikimate 5-dehydrogenase
MADLDEVTDHARQIGAVNTVVPFVDGHGERRLRGDNTD